MKNKIVKGLERDSFLKKAALFIWGVLLYSISFSLFFSNNDIVTGGSTGIALIINEIYKIDVSTFVFVFSVIALIIGFFFLGLENTLKTISGVLILPIFLKFTSIFPRYIDLSNLPMFMIILLGGIIMGLGNGIILRSGYSVGGFQTIYQILYKCFYISIGKSTLILNGILVLISSFIFGWDKALYAILGLFIASKVTDKVMLETSISKSFFIITDKYKEINDYIITILGRSATIVNATGGYSNSKKKILLCVMPTRQYFLAKQTIQEIDENAFFLITDTYEIYGGV
ncbi:MAG: YitT family protein [Bacilli bacterium]|nr:YitT family protein [Bacilli bacterium]